MFAVVKTGGKQYRVAENQIMIVEKILGESGAAHTFEEVLLLEDGAKITVGAPRVEGAKVVASIVEQTKGDKVIIFKKVRRHTYRRKKGHRQELTVLRVQQIAKPGEAIRPIEVRAVKAKTAPGTVTAEAKTETKAAAPKKAAAKPTTAAKKPVVEAASKE